MLDCAFSVAARLVTEGFLVCLERQYLMLDFRKLQRLAIFSMCVCRGLADCCVCMRQLANDVMGKSSPARRCLQLSIPVRP
jgi:hypothetical protein